MTRKTAAGILNFRTFVFTLQLIFISASASAQTFRKLCDQADSCYYAKDYKKSIAYYHKAFELDKKNKYYLYNAACSAALEGNSPLAFEWLNQAVKYGWLDIVMVQNDKDFSSLHEDEEWPVLIEKMKAKVAKKERHYDHALQKELSDIMEDDQKVRNEINDFESGQGNDLTKVDSLVKVIQEKDSLNLIKIERILDERGWVGPDKVGDASQAIFLVIQHSDLKTQEKYLPMMREAVKKKKAYPAELAMLEDRVAMRQGKKQLYGSQIGRDENTNEFFVMPLEDPDHVDERRSKMGLGPIADYVKLWKIQWDVETYKKQLPELEKIMEMRQKM